MRLLIGTYATTIHAVRLDPASGRLTQVADIAIPRPACALFTSIG